MNSSQENVLLHDRALFAAWASNVLTMLYVNLTNKDYMQEWRGYEKLKPGISYLFENESNSTIGGTLAKHIPKPGRISLHRLGFHFDIPSSRDFNYLTGNDDWVFANPHHVTHTDFRETEMCMSPLQLKIVRILI